MSSDVSPICDICGAWMLNMIDNPVWLKCLSCGFCKKENKKIVTPVGDKSDKPTRIK